MLVDFDCTDRVIFDNTIFQSIAHLSSLECHGEVAPQHGFISGKKSPFLRVAKLFYERITTNNSD